MGLVIKSNSNNIPPKINHNTFILFFAILH